MSVVQFQMRYKIQMCQIGSVSLLTKCCAMPGAAVNNNSCCMHSQVEARGFGGFKFLLLELKGNNSFF